MSTWMQASLVKYYQLLPGHHCASASLFPALSLSIPLSSLLSSLSQRGSKNSGELNSHNNMRLSGDRRSTVWAGQYRGSNSSEPGLLTARASCDKRVTVGICLSVVSNSHSFCSSLLFVPFPLLAIFPTSIYLKKKKTHAEMCSWQKKSLKEGKGNKSQKKRLLKWYKHLGSFFFLILLLKIMDGGKFGEVWCKVKVSSRKNWNFAITNL